MMTEPTTHDTRMRYPNYKTQVEIVQESVRRYAMEFLMKDDPIFTEEEAKVVVDNLVGFGDGGTYEDINEEEFQEYFDVYEFDPTQDTWPKIPWWGWAFIALVTVVIITHLVL